jgi:hypothetical protein
MEQRTREKASQAVSDILKTAGFDVHHAPSPLDLSAVRRNSHILVLCTDDQEVAGKFSDTEFTIKTEQGDAICEKLLVTFNPSIASDECIVWYPEEFALFAGEAVLARVLGRTLVLPLNEAEESAQKNRTSSNQESSNNIRIAHLPVKVHRDEAEEMAGIPGVTTLRFLPYWMFKYTSRGSAEFKDQKVLFDGTGSGALNAINGSFTDVNSDSITRREIPSGSDILKPTITRDEAGEKIVQFLIKSMTRRIKIRQVRGDAIFYEEKDLFPDRDNFALEIRELYLPVWQIKGKKIIEINACTGERLKEPLDDGVEVF